jgi:outer membrane receptor protein involved in Fe transport
MQKIKKILFTALAVLLSYIAVGQVTTSSINGSIKDKAGTALEGATVTATHTPTGTVYVTVSKKGGTFNVPNARIGGPYTLKIEYVGFTAQILEGINLQLGEPYGVSIVMGENVKSITEVVVTGTTKRKVFADKSGPSTIIGQQQLKTIPNFSRNLADFTTVTPQAGSNNSFGGRDGRFNNIQVDGANLNNNFGLRSDPLPGGSISSPISLDAIEEISVNIAPFDIRQSGFTGAGINAVTKSGTNTFRGGAYGYLRTQDMNGRKVIDSVLPKFQVSNTKFIGGYVGGPIIKNKLFFFVSGEFEKREFPGIQFQPKGSTGGLNQSTTPIDSLRILSDYLKQQYGYNTGAYENFPNYQLQNYKVMAKIDWNISRIHKLTLRYNEFVNNNDEQLNGNSIINNPTVQVTGPSGSNISVSRLPNARFGPFSSSYANSIYGFENVVRTGALELNSSSKGKWANQFLTTFTLTRATRTSPSTDFPLVDIFNGAGQNQITFGYEPFTYNNDVVNNTFNVTDNFNYFAGKHTLTFGINYEQQYLGNSFMPGAQSAYVFNSLSDFLNNRAPRYFGYTYSLVPGKSKVYSAELKFGQAALYAQDEINISDRFKLTIGFRADKPIYLENPLSNPAIDKLILTGKDGVATSYSTAKWPSSQILLSPRLGFRYDAAGDKSIIFRGGTGIFTGRIPFVWLTNMPTNAGVAQNQVVITDLIRLQNFRFNPNINAYRDSFPNTITSTVPTNFVLIDPDFKFPSIWRTYLAAEKSLGNGWVITTELAFAKDINAVIMRNANLKAPDAAFAGNDNRPRYTSNANAVRRVNPAFGQAIILENTNEGFSTFVTASVSKAFKKGFYASLAYTYTSAVEFSGNPGAQAGTAWSGIASRRTANDPELGWNSDMVPHRILGIVSYKKEYLKRFATTITLLYDGSAAGNFSYVYNGDMNNDGNNGSDLLYIPNNASELTFVPITGATPFTVQAQVDAFEKFIENTPYLNKRRGSYAQRNAGLLPFFNRVNLSVRQEVYTVITKSGRKQSLQLTADVFNFLNMLNKDWGIRPLLLVNDPLVFAGVGASGQPTYRMRVVNGQLPTRIWQNNFSTSSTWGAQVGVRYEF